MSGFSTVTLQASALIRSFLSVAAAACLWSTFTFAGQDAGNPNTTPVNRFLDSSTSVIGWSDISKVDLNQLAEFTKRFRSGNPDMSQPEAVRQAMVQLGVRRVFWVSDLSQLPKGPQAVIVPVPVDKAESVTFVLRAVVGETRGKAVVDEDVVIVGTIEAVDMLLRQHQGEVDSDFLESVNSLSGPNGLAIRTPVASLVPIVSVLPELVGDDQGLVAEVAELLVRVKSVAWSGDFPPVKSQFQVTTDSEEAAAKLVLLINGLVKNQIAEASSSVQLQATGNRLAHLTNSREEADATIESLVMLAAPARRQAQHQMIVNSLRQIALAMHNFHSAHGHFPPQALADEKGQRLLSWRVLILPYIDHADLYQRFRLDEPWDSEHNRKLIPLMPEIYGPAGAEQIGMTKIVAPLTEGSVFGRKGAVVKLSEIKDGAGNTILVTEASSAAAVVWTKPADLKIDVGNPLAMLVGGNADSFRACMCDGSVRVISGAVTSELLNAVLTFDGREPVDSSQL